MKTILKSKLRKLRVIGMFLKIKQPKIITWEKLDININAYVYK